MGSKLETLVSFDTPKKGKYLPSKAKDYIVEFSDKEWAYIRETKYGDNLTILGPGSKLKERALGLTFSGISVFDPETGLCAFYANDHLEKIGSGGRPIYLGKVIKWRKHSPFVTLSGSWSNYKAPENKLYFVTNRWEPSGFYAIAKSPQAARSLLYDELDCSYLDCRAVRIPVKDEWRLANYPENSVIYPDDTKVLDQLGVKYGEPEDW